LRLLNNRVGNAVDLAGGAVGDVMIAEPGARGEDFRVSQGGEGSGRSGLGGAVAVAGVDVEAKNRLSGGGEGKEGEGEGGWEKHCRKAWVQASSSAAQCSNSCSTDEEGGSNAGALGRKEKSHIYI